MTVICESIFVWFVVEENGAMVEKPVNPKCGLRVECVGGNRHGDNISSCGLARASYS